MLGLVDRIGNHFLGVGATDGASRTVEEALNSGWRFFRGRLGYHCRRSLVRTTFAARNASILFLPGLFFYVAADR